MWNCIFSSECAGSTVPLHLRSPSRKAGKFYEVDCSKLKTKSIEKVRSQHWNRLKRTPWCVKITLIWYSKRQDTSVIWRGDLPMLKDTTVTSSLHYKKTSFSKVSINKELLHAPCNASWQVQKVYYKQSPGRRKKSFNSYFLKFVKNALFFFFLMEQYFFNDLKYA